MWHEGSDLLAHALVALVTSPPVPLLISERGSRLYSERFSAQLLSRVQTLCLRLFLSPRGFQLETSLT
jgi:hypothetical protein